MKQVAIVAVLVMVLLVPSLGQAQTKGSYHPLSNGEMSQQGIWESWIFEFNSLTGKQKAEVVRRHIQKCLDSFEMTDEQRAVVKDMTTKYVTEAAYSETDPEKRRAMQQTMQPDSEKAMAILGRELGMLVFGAKPPIEVLIAVKNDPAFK
jgi:Spy/CpxP family protein refolding chaperone